MDAFIGLGSNLGDRGAHLAAGLAGLEAAGLGLVATSSVWETEPIDVPSTRWFWNMVVRARAEREALELLDLLLAIERRAGRERGAPNAPRTLDLDLLLLGSVRLDHPRLSLPHPRLWERRFVLAPLAEIAPRLRNPASGLTVSEELARLRSPGEVRRLGRLAPARGVPL